MPIASIEDIMTANESIQQIVATISHLNDDLTDVIDGLFAITDGEASFYVRER